MYMYFTVCMLQLKFHLHVRLIFIYNVHFGSLNCLCLLALEHKEIENKFGLKTFTFTCTDSKVVVKHNSHNFIFVSINNH